MDVKVRCCPLGFSESNRAADGSIILEEAVEQWLNSEDYKGLIDGRLGLGSLTHRVRSIETASDSIGNIAALKKTIGKDDLGLIVSPEAPTFTHYVKEFFIDTYKGTHWLCANLHIFSEDDGFDSIATENIKRLRALINNHVRLTCSLIVVAFWQQEPGSKCDIAKKIKTIKSCDFTVNPSFGMNARIYEVTDDNGKVIESEKKYSEVDLQEYNSEDSGVIKVKTFSDLSGFDLKDTPKTSKIDGKFTTLKIKEFSYFGEVSVIEDEKFEDNTINKQLEQKEFTQVAVKDRLRECKMSPRMYFRRMIISYKQVVKSFGGPDKIKEEDKKILQALLTSDVLYILGQISSEVIEKNKQINTLLGCSSISKNLRQSAQKLQLVYRLSGLEAKKQGFVSKMRYQKLRDAWSEFVKAVIEEVFGSNHANIPSEAEQEIEEGK